MVLDVIRAKGRDEEVRVVIVLDTGNQSVFSMDSSNEEGRKLTSR